MASRTVIQDISNFLKKDYGFKLPLSILVKGKNAFGNSFVEKTELSYISHKGGSFWLKTPILFGSNLELNIDLPSNLGAENLTLYLQGKAVFIEAINGHTFCQRVSLRFNNNFKIHGSKKGLNE